MLGEDSGVYVGIDPSISNTGVVVLSAYDGKPVEGVNGGIACKSKKFSCDIQRYSAQADYIASKLDAYDVKGVAYENYSYNSVHKAFSIAEYNGILKRALLEIGHGQDILLVAPATNKKFATGHGTADKHMMIEQALVEGLTASGLDCHKLTDDICDAYFLARMAFYVFDVDGAISADANLNANIDIKTRVDVTRKLREARDAQHNALHHG